MIRHNDKGNFRNATFGARQDRSNLFGLAALRLRARFARDGPGSTSDDSGPNFPPEDGRGDSDSTPAC
jgi:hypothetical protein